MKIAIIGAGFCGLAVAWTLASHSSPLPHLNITVFDARPIGTGTSGISAGLLHPYAGARAKLNWKGYEAFQATQELLNISRSALGYPVTAERSGILRLALSEIQEEDFHRCVAHHAPHVSWLSPDDTQSIAPGAPTVPSLFIPNALTVYSSLYLRGLWEACAQHGAQFVQKRVSIGDLSAFDVVIFATGTETSFPALSSLPIQIVKGQVLELRWPSSLPPLRYPLNSHVYLLMASNGKSCLVGATYEKGNVTDTPQLERAIEEILPKAYELFPPLRSAQVMRCQAGLRAVAPLHRPLIQRLDSRQWVITGMGSKGLLYHALFARQLVDQLLQTL